MSQRPLGPGELPSVPEVDTSVPRHPLPSVLRPLHLTRPRKTWAEGSRVVEGLVTPTLHRVFRPECYLYLKYRKWTSSYLLTYPHPWEGGYRNRACEGVLRGRVPFSGYLSLSHKGFRIRDGPCSGTGGRERKPLSEWPRVTCPVEDQK